MHYTQFLKKGFYLFTIFAIFLTFLNLSSIVQEGIGAAWAGLIISFFNFLVGAGIISWGIGKKDSQFYGAFFGGMLFRFLIIFLVLLLLVKKFNLHQLALVISLLLTYFGFLFLEIWILNKYSEGNERNR
jgi:uncharacterized membrane protein